MDNEPRGRRRPAGRGGTVRSPARRHRAGPPPRARRGHAGPRAGAGAADRRLTAELPTLRLRPPTTTIPSPRRNRMFTFAIRGLAAATAAAALIGAWLYNQVSSTAAADLGAVLTRTSAAKSLELQDHAGRQDGRGLGPRPETPPQPARRHVPDRPRRQSVARRREGESGQHATSVSLPRRGRRLDLLALLDVPADQAWRQAEGTAGEPAGGAGDPRWPRLGNLPLGQPPGRTARCGSRPWWMPRPSCSSRSKACGSAASGPSRSANWRSSPATNRSTKTCSSSAIR